ncbi:hypothetical protein GCM10009809_28530 [Isoptericola hypogeus]|uniref:Uncharacterized protein n=1 Tax=Isoptericola hypogeus TaxID=300179 RepID=A0ABP4VPV5_9MICO
MRRGALLAVVLVVAVALSTLLLARVGVGGEQPPGSGTSGATTAAGVVSPAPASPPSGEAAPSVPPAPSVAPSPSGEAAPSATPAATVAACPWGGRLDRPDRSVEVDYPVSGYFMLTTADRCATRAKVQGAHAIGADTIVTFGAELTPVTVGALRRPAKDNPFAGFAVDGTDGYRYATARTGGGRIRDVYTYANKSAFSDAALFCPRRDGRSRTPDGDFTWWLLPVEGGYSDCDSPSRTYDLVVSYGGSVDADTLLVADAARFGMSVYLGMPRPRPDPGVGFVADASYTQTLGGFTSRVLADWDRKFGRLDAFAGAYQTVETAVFTNADVWRPNLKVYELQNRIVGFRLPKAKQRVVVSPYADLRRGALPVSAVRPSFQQIADTAAGVRMILAPQDGGGTGRVGAFRPGDGGTRVRADLRGVVGRTTYGAAYAASTATLYAEASRVRGVTLWANVEAFRPPGQVGHRAPGRLDVLDTQVALARPHVQKVIAYRWDEYLDGSGLADQIRARG